MTGTVLCGANNVFNVDCEDAVVRRCSLKGKKLKDVRGFYNPLAPGDRVDIGLDSSGSGSAIILRVRERKNSFVRWNVKGRMPQIIAANIDRLMLIITPAMPPFRPRFVDRVLCQTEDAGIETVIVFNKSDIPLDSETARETEARKNDWQRIGYRCMPVSAKTGAGFAELAALLEGKVSAFAGQSGAGKSSVINRLDPTLALKTAELSEKYGRGNHTTTQGALFTVSLSEITGTQGSRAMIIDTPGVRRFALDGISRENLAFCFREMKGLIGKCEFGMSCTHTNEAGCAVLGAVQSGLLSGERYESYLRIADEIESGNWID
ncbi:MAG: ribosome small subunit-dependent GTPase A [Treponemataceae bacterium]|nr:MAG: ribosome small subunit-dependent GTPase A [Treponemataceae bacterium]